jgi:hypothetical protein
MAEIEHNQINRVGILPSYDMDSIRQYPRRPYNSTQIVSGLSGSSVAVIVRTVAAGKTLYLCSAVISVYNGDAAFKYGNMFIRDDADTFWCYLITLYTPPSAAQNQGLYYVPPVEVPSGYDVCIQTNDNDCVICGSIKGYEI